MEQKVSGVYPEISIILPCLNEEKAIGACLEQIKTVIKANNLNAEIIVVDNGSTDKSCQIAVKKGVHLVHEEEKGYGCAYLKGFSVARGKYLFLADSDASYDFNEIPKFTGELKKGYDFVLGNRFKGKIAKNAMPWAHRYIGNPVLSGVLRLFFKVKVHDAHCGMRAITSKALEMLNLKTIGMEFASEMIIMAGKNNLKIAELPIDYHKRLGNSKLKSFVDGWRHLRFMLLYSPLFLFFLPGVVLFLTGAGLMLWMYFASPTIFGLKLHFHPMFFAALLIIIGYQLVIFALFAKTYSITHLKDEPIFDKFYKYVTIEKASIIGILMVFLGLIIYFGICAKWLKSGFGEINEVKNSIVALTLVIIGMQTVFSSFMLSILGIKER
jgi:glycosyltransferase involved in cell wall biosynthesis